MVGTPIVAAVLLLVVGGCSAHTTLDQPPTPGASPVTSFATSSVDATTPPAASPSAEGPTASTTPTSTTAPSPPPSATPTHDARKEVDVMITSATWNPVTSAVEVVAITPVVEDNGTCTLRLTAGAKTVNASGPAHADASSTSCGLLAVAGNRLTPGTWQIAVTYDSPDSRGSSAQQPVKVP